MYCYIADSTILGVKKAGHLNVKKLLADTLKKYSLASQSERVPQSCFYVKVARLSYAEYTYLSQSIDQER